MRKMKNVALFVMVVLVSAALFGCGASNQTDQADQTDQTASAPTVKYIDLSHQIVNGTVTYPGMPATEISTVFDRETTAGWNGNLDVSSCLLGEIKMVGINGTYIDAPFHVYPDGHTVKDYPIEKLVNLPGVVVKMSSDKNYFDVDDIEGLDVKGKAILFYSGHDQYFMTDNYGKNVPYLTLDLAKALVEGGAALVGIDGPLVDDMANSAKIGIPVHYELLGKDIPICEDMTNLGALPADGFTFTAIPPAVDMESFACRAFATVPETIK